jgi:hypothetical protein
MKLGRAELTTLVLAALAVASVLLVLGTQTTPTTGERDARAKNLIPIWHPEELRRVVLKKSGETVTLEREHDDWLVRAPEPEPADDAAVTKLVSAVGFATPVRRLEGADLTSHGLAHPRATLTLEQGADRLVLSLGDDAPSPTGGAYVALDASGAPRTGGVVPPDTARLFATTTDDLRQHQLVTLGARDLSELVLERPDSKLRLVRGQGLAFRLDGAERANRDALEPVFAALSHVTATRFLPLATAEPLQKGARITRITLIPREKPAEKAVLELGGACPGAPEELVAIVRAAQARAACVAAGSLGPLSLGREALVDRFPFAARKDEVEGFVLDRAGRRLSLERRGTAFLLREPSEAQVELDAGNRRIEAVVRAQAEPVERPDAKALGLDPPEGHLTLHVIGDDDKGGEEKLDIGKTAPDGTLYLRRVEDGAVLAVGREAARAFLVDSTLLRSQKILDFALSALAELELSAPEHQVVRRVPTGFSLVTPAGFDADGELTTEAVLALGSLTALRWVADEDDGTFGLQAPTLTARARVDTDAGSGEHLLRVGRPTPGGYFAALAGTAGVFLIERGVAARLSTLLVNRAELMADPKTLARLTLSAKGRELVFERHGAELAAKLPEIPAESATRATEALASLSAEAALHSGPARPGEGFDAPSMVIHLEPGPGLGKPRTFRFGGTSSFRDEAVRYARVDGDNATFVVAEQKLRPMFDLF